MKAQPKGTSMKKWQYALCGFAVLFFAFASVSGAIAQNKKGKNQNGIRQADAVIQPLGTPFSSKCTPITQTPRMDGDFEMVTIMRPADAVLEKLSDADKRKRYNFLIEIGIPQSAVRVDGNTNATVLNAATCIDEDGKQSVRYRLRSEVQTVDGNIWHVTRVPLPKGKQEIMLRSCSNDVGVCFRGHWFGNPLNGVKLKAEIDKDGKIATIQSENLPKTWD